MIWEIAEIGAGEGERDVLVEVHYWYGKRAAGPPDFTEHHLIHNVPEATGPIRKPVVAPNGYFIALDGSHVSPWVQVDGNWVHVTPPLDGLQCTEEPGKTLGDFLTEPLEVRAQEVAAKRPRGRDVFAPGQVRANVSAAHIALTDGAVGALRGRRRER